MRAPFSILDLRLCPEFAAPVAERIWRAWWNGRGYPLAYIQGRLQENLASDGVPVCYVACRGDQLLGTSSLIESDCSARPHYTPWVAAVWVKPQERRKGVGGALVRHAAAAALELRRRPVYLCSAVNKREFYQRLGWTAIEEGVGADSLTVFTFG